MAEPETDISLRAAQVAADVTEAEQPQERRRLANSFAKAASSGARAAGRGTRVVRRGVSARSAARRGANAGTGYLVAQVITMAPRLRVRNQAALQARFPGKAPDEIARALIEGAARASAAVGGAGGVVSVLPVLPAFPAEVVAETLVVVGIEIKLVAELHEAYGTPGVREVPGADECLCRGVGAPAWRFDDSRRGDLRGRIPADPAASAPPRRPGRPQRVLPRPAAYRRRRGRHPERPGDQKARQQHSERSSAPRTRQTLMPRP